MLEVNYHVERRVVGGLFALGGQEWVWDHARDLARGEQLGGVGAKVIPGGQLTAQETAALKSKTTPQSTA